MIGNKLMVTMGKGCWVAKSRPTLWDLMDCSKQGCPVLHYLPEFAQTHVHWVSDAISSSVSLFFLWCGVREKAHVLPQCSQFSHSVVSDSLRPPGLQHARPPCPSPTPGAYSNSCPLSRWCHLILCCPLLLPTSVFPRIRIFSNESSLRIMLPKY